MALNPSGPISLAGPTAGQSIAVELGLKIYYILWKIYIFTVDGKILQMKD